MKRKKKIESVGYDAGQILASSYQTIPFLQNAPMHLFYRIQKMPLWLLLFAAATVHSQQILPLTDLSYWKTGDGKNWQIVSDATVDLHEHERMSLVQGTGVLGNLPDANNRSNLLSVKEFGDVDVS